MFRRLLGAVLAALLSTHAFAFDPTKAARYPSADMNRLDVGQITVHGSGSTGPVDGMTVAPGPSTTARALSGLLGDRASIASYVLITDAGDYAPAIERAAAAGVKELFFPSGVQYTLKRTFTLPNANMRIVCAARKQTEIRLLGANDYFGIIGNASTESNNFHVDGCLFTKEQASTAGAVFKLQNVYLWSFDHIRVYGDNKLWRALELYSAIGGVSRDVNVDNVLDKVVYGTGGTASPGNPGGPVYDTKFDHWYSYGSNTATTDATKDGAFYFDDNFQAIVVENALVGKHRGYAFYFNGTVANRGTNILNFIVNPNVESNYDNTGVAYFGGTSSSQIGGSVSWVTSHGGTNGAAFPGIYLSKNAQNITVKGMQHGMATAGAIGVLDDGQRNRVEDMEFVGYDTNADVAVQIGPDALKGTYKRLSVSQIKRVILDQSPDAAGHVFDSIDYDSISGQPLTGLVGSTSSNKVVGRITNMDAGPPALFAAATLNVPDKGEVFTINSAGTINGITPTYIGRKITFNLAAANTTFANTQSAPGTGAFYIPGGAFTNSAAPAAITFTWMGDFWWASSVTR